MKKFLIFTIIGLIGFSCKKPLEEIEAGQSRKMFMQQHCLNIYKEKDDIPDFSQLEYSYHDTNVFIDIDLDGTNDIEFQSSFEYKQDPKFTSASSIKIINTDYAISRDLNKTKYYIGEGCFYNVVYENYGAFVRATHQAWDGCKKEFPCNQVGENYFAPEIKYKSQQIQNNSDWNNSDSMLLYVYYIHEAQCEFNNSQDTLYCISKIRDNSCLISPINQEIYIPISKLVDNERYLGWIKIRLSGENTIEILETAIQEH
jgi:hypothetical protein